MTITKKILELIGEIDLKYVDEAEKAVINQNEIFDTDITTLYKQEIKVKKKVFSFMSVAACFLFVSLSVFAIMSISKSSNLIEIDRKSTDPSTVEHTVLGVVTNITITEPISTEPIISVTEVEITEPISTEPTVSEIISDMPKPFGESGEGTGGDERTDFIQPCNHKLDSVSVNLLRLAPEDELNKWIEENDNRIKSGIAPTSLDEYINVYSFIKKFNISDEDVSAALSFEINSNDPVNYLTKEELDIILSQDENAILQYFATDYSIVIENKIYTPQWVYEHNNYEEVGITKEMISEKLPLYSNLPLSQQAKEAFEAKLSLFLLF
ncbi:MAG: hypothetical protein LBM93_02220 [Oscillospiraceae bacterium]|jgi:hypothetical protein|nr:hypothetical protein [Oscillospiraceae bacterium]